MLGGLDHRWEAGGTGNLETTWSGGGKAEGQPIATIF
ncbi:MAG TPA: hypothetical protein IGS52_11445 [Oscillatoriaceae cyanobacterium M33_DOE_052]|uniref:Uncharacterized protein n=1 Tax=Planktothricoides sp. SpSt-374 TaxID=2282167 RepID=A0A7C3VNQ6_9CYAN|nr:hypothetical protein [Oscillatoriaceae cyanobacterium M33_DOE_052]